MPVPFKRNVFSEELYFKHSARVAAPSIEETINLKFVTVVFVLRKSFKKTVKVSSTSNPEIATVSI